jgi:hypothetical protein
VDLDRWLGPRARTGFFERMLPFALGSGPAAARDAAIGRLAAYGRLRVTELALAPFRLERFDGSVDLAGRDLLVRHAQANFFDGRLSGDFEARLLPEPVYSFRGLFERVNLATLSAANPGADLTTAPRFAGSASGEVLLAARGIGKQQLLATLSGQADFRVREPVIRGLELLSSSAVPLLGPLSAADLPGRFPAEPAFTSASGSLRIAESAIHVDQLSLLGRENHTEIQGTVDSSLRLDLRVRSAPRAVASDASFDADPSPDSDEWALAGSLDAPVLTHRANPSNERAVARGPVRR